MEQRNAKKPGSPGFFYATLIAQKIPSFFFLFSFSLAPGVSLATMTGCVWLGLAPESA
jgi:hypothetical protein